jgi:hypothetical protein
MTRHIERLDFNLTFFKGEEEKTLHLCIDIDRAEYNDPKEAAIAEVGARWAKISAEVGKGWLPKFKTFRVLRCRKLDDLAWSR